MWSRRDQLQAYQFLRRRLVSAVLLGDANHPESPSKRTVTTTITGVVVTLLTMAGFAVWGAFRPGASTAWDDGKHVIVERESGTRYVIGVDRTTQKKVLQPALNYASAALFVGARDVISVSRNSLRKMPRGESVGIADAPDALPLAKAMLPGPWTACASSGVSSAAAATPTVSVSVGAPASGELLEPDQGVLVRTAGKGAQPSYLIAAGRRFEIDSQVASVLGYDRRETYLPVSTLWLNAVPAGPRLTFLTVPGAGTAGVSIGGKTLHVGQVVTVAQQNERRHYLYLGDGLVPISETEALLFGDNPARRDDPITLTAGQVAPLKAPRRATGFPERPPTLREVTDEKVWLCAGTAPGSSPTGGGSADFPALAISLRAEVAVGTPTGSGAANGRADHVWVPPGGGALVRAAPNNAFPSQTYYLVTDQGRRYAVLNSEAITALGYAPASATPVPLELIKLLPEGPELSRRQASQSRSVDVPAPQPATPSPGPSQKAGPTPSPSRSARQA